MIPLPALVFDQLNVRINQLQRLHLQVSAQKRNQRYADIQFLRVNPATGQPALPWGPRGMEVALREAQVQKLSPALGGSGRRRLRAGSAAPPP